jgi:hypothetical protein
MLGTTVSKGLLLILGVIAANAASYFGIATGSTLLKWMYVLLQLLTLCFSFAIIHKNRRFLSVQHTVVAVLITVTYPLAFFIYAQVQEPTVRNFVDFFLLDGAYYLSFFIALALALLDASGERSVETIRNSIALAFPFALVVVVVFCRPESITTIGYGHLAIDNVFIPGSVLLVVTGVRYCRLLGVVSLAALFATSSIIWSRSYFLVGVCLAGLVFVEIVRQPRSLRAWLTGFASGVILVPTLVLGIYLSVTGQSYVQDKTLLDKFDLEGLATVLIECVSSMSLEPLSSWEGNSRRDVLQDAFVGFDVTDWMFGRGPVGVYESFELRRIIEVGYAQEAFRWGAIYVFLNILLSFYAVARLYKARSSSRHPLSRLLALSLVTRLVDMGVFGIPRASLYATLAMWAIASVCVKRARRE